MIRFEDSDLPYLRLAFKAAERYMGWFPPRLLARVDNHVANPADRRREQARQAMARSRARKRDELVPLRKPGPR